MRRRTPSCSSSRSCAASTFSLTPGSRSRSSAKRRDPNPRCHTISTFHFPAKTFDVACTGHPKWFFMGAPRAYKIVRTSHVREAGLLWAALIRRRLVVHDSSRIHSRVAECIAFVSPTSSEVESGFSHKSVCNFDLHLGTRGANQRLLRVVVWHREPLWAGD